MCGICGIINRDRQPVKEANLHAMMAKMKYRGPDDEGTFCYRHVGLGFVRLSILDLSYAGHQPFQDAGNRYSLIFNGEIYNYIELRKELERLGEVFISDTDTEVLLKSYIRWGMECLDKLNGMFAFVIFDKHTDRIFGARDRYGIKPLYYCVTDKQFVFASEIPPILETECLKARANEQVIFDYLVFNRTDQTENTFFEGIKKLQHGCCFTIEGDKFETAKWYDLKEKVKSAEPFQDAEEYKACLKSSVGLRLRSDVPVGVCLSGGLDSSSITSLLLRDFHKKDLNAFSAVYGRGQTGDESEYINEYKGQLNHIHFTTPTARTLLNDLLDFVRIQAEPVPSLGPYAQYKVMQKAKGNVVVTLDGQGADEELAGYHYFFSFFFKDLFRERQYHTLLKEMVAYRRIHHSFFAYKIFLYFLLPEKLRSSTRVDEYGYLTPSFVREHVNSNSIAGNLYGSPSLNQALLDHFEYKLEHLLKWNDRNSMASSIESRVPFLDYRLVERTLATSSNKKIHRGVTKILLREAMTGTVPEKIRLRMDKVGFSTPQDEWFREEQMVSFIHGIITSSSFRSREIFDADKVLRLYEQHLNRKINISKEIWKWIHLELWYRTFIDE